MQEGATPKGRDWPLERPVKKGEEDEILGVGSETKVRSTCG